MPKELVCPECSEVLSNRYMCKECYHRDLTLRKWSLLYSVPIYGLIGLSVLLGGIFMSLTIIGMILGIPAILGGIVILVVAFYTPNKIGVEAEES